jgi:hypothetical protein
MHQLNNTACNTVKCDGVNTDAFDLKLPRSHCCQMIDWVPLDCRALLGSVKVPRDCNTYSTCHLCGADNFFDHFERIGRK